MARPDVRMRRALAALLADYWTLSPVAFKDGGELLVARPDSSVMGPACDCLALFNHSATFCGVATPGRVITRLSDAARFRTEKARELLGEQSARISDSRRKTDRSVVNILNMVPMAMTLARISPRRRTSPSSSSRTCCSHHCIIISSMCVAARASLSPPPEQASPSPPMPPSPPSPSSVIHHRHHRPMAPASPHVHPQPPKKGGQEVTNRRTTRKHA